MISADDHAMGTAKAPCRDLLPKLVREGAVTRVCERVLKIKMQEVCSPFKVMVLPAVNGGDNDVIVQVASFWGR